MGTASVEHKVLELIDDMPKGALISAGRLFWKVRHPAGRKRLFQVLERLARSGKIRRSVDHKGVVRFGRSHNQPEATE